jgi:aspartyl-tRNA(Asn)/glutamyl-tRNA(Gln) amidotransferase subunit C
VAELSSADVSEIAHLAMLSLSADEAERMRVELSAILEVMAALAAVELPTGAESVAPMTHAMPMDLRLRPDVAEPSLPAQEALAASPSHDDDSFVVPVVIASP